MRVAVIRFPGSNCDQDAYPSLRDDMRIAAEYVWHEETSLRGFDAAFIPGGFSYGDYLRCGAMASRAPIMDEVARFAREGRPVIGACNGFQILCEAGLLPGALLLNIEQKFVCQTVELEAVNRRSMWTSGVTRKVRIPIAHGEGRFVCDADTLARLQDDDLIAFRYVGENPNGAVDRIAGVVNPAGNVLGLMPHPERATREVLGLTDGRLILQGLALAVV
jgi:phosphoribosylformylglycinamidine synthase subunit PurQ / glutaminase